MLMYSLEPVRYEIVSLVGTRVAQQDPLRKCPAEVQLPPRLAVVMHSVGPKINAWIADDLQCNDRCSGATTTECQNHPKRASRTINCISVTSPAALPPRRTRMTNCCTGSCARARIVHPPV